MEQIQENYDIFVELKTYSTIGKHEKSWINSKRNYFKEDVVCKQYIWFWKCIKQKLSNVTWKLLL